MVRLRYRLRRGQHRSSGSNVGTAAGSVIYRPALLLSLQLLLLSARPAEPFLSSPSHNHHGHLATSNNADETDSNAPLTKPIDTAHAYAVHWEDLLTLEHREIATELRARRGKWSNDRLESTGMAVLDAIAEPETELYGEKVVRVTKEGETRMRDRFSTGDILVLTASYRERFVPREVCVVDVFKDGMTLSVGPTWPAGLWEERRRPGSYIVRLDRTAPQATLLAQRKSLQMVRKGEAGSVASFLADSFFNTDSKSRELASQLPPRFVNGAYIGGIVEADVNVAIGNALDAAKNAKTRFRPNPSQCEAISWALSRRISLCVGPPGTGKTRVAAMLIATALRLRSAPNGDLGSAPPKVLAVAHSNGAADVLLEALLAIGVPAIRAGRPATVSPNARKRTAVAMTQTHPEVIALGKQARNASLPESIRSHAAAEAKRVADEVRYTIAQAAPVVVASCIGAHQLLKDGMGIGLRFPLVVLDEASQTTEPALICALAAAKAEQIVMVGDTKQLPPTVASGTTDLRSTLGVSPMARLENGGVDERTLKTQYRCPPSLLEFPSKYFYGGKVKCSPGAKNRDGSELPAGFPWPGKNNKTMPLAFVHLGGDLETTHDFGGRSNTPEAELVCRIVMDLLSGGDVEAHNIAIISPYSRQVDKIRGELSGRNIRNVRVGTVDSFQGQEKDIVIISGTRSNDVGDVGFLRDPRRLNVALTRAKRGLIIVGDQKTLRNSRHWAALLDSCLQRGCMMDAAVLRRRESDDKDEDEEDDTVDSASDGEDDLLSSLFSTEDALANLLK